MDKRTSIIFKIILIIALIGLSLIPLYYMQQYVQSLINEQNSLISIASNSVDYISGLVDSAKGEPSTKDVLDLKTNYLLSKNNISSAPLTLGLAFLFLLIIDIVKSSKLSLLHYVIAAIGFVLFYLMALSLAHYVDFSIAYFVSAGVCCLLLTIYLSSSLKSVMAGTIYGISLLITYCFSFYLLKYIDNVLVYGAVCLLIVFITVILMTRKVETKEKPEVTEGGVRKLN